MSISNWQHLVFSVHLFLSSGSLHCKSCSRTGMSISGMSFLLPPFSSSKEGSKEGGRERENSSVELI